MKSAFMIAAAGSGCGKTTVTCALLTAYKNKGLKTQAFKCGPDYIDPLFHKEVIGVPSKNLDLFFSSKEDVHDLFYCGNSSEVSIVEGVMGLYDGYDPKSNAGSSYDLACALNIPIILVVDAHGMGRSILALIKGYLDMDEAHLIKGIFLNNISSMYCKTIAPIIEEELGLKVVGSLPKLKEGGLESRYLGLKMPSEIEDIKGKLNGVAEALVTNTDLGELLALGKVSESAPLRVQYIDGVHCTIAVARDDVFCFYYEENLRLLEEYGARLVFFSPMDDFVLPESVDGLLLGGGYPELHCDQLSQNESMRRSIRSAIEEGMPSLAECGGFMYLHDAIITNEKKYPMVGALQGTCEKRDHLVRFGYMTIEEKGSLFMEGMEKGIRGHEFHYYDSSNNGCDGVATKPVSKKSWEAAHIDENHWWGFAHLYYLSNPDFAKAFVDKCIKYRKEKNG